MRVKFSGPGDRQAAFDDDLADDFVKRIAGLETEIAARRSECKQAKQELKECRGQVAKAENWLYAMMPGTTPAAAFVRAAVERRRSLGNLVNLERELRQKLQGKRALRDKAQGELLAFIDKWSERLPLFEGR